MRLPLSLPAAARLLAPVLTLAAVLALPPLAAADYPGATLTLRPGTNDAVLDKPFPVIAEGTNPPRDQTYDLVIKAKDKDVTPTCAPAASEDDGWTVQWGANLAAGPFSYTQPVTISGDGESTVLICAYTEFIIDTVATASLTVKLRPPRHVLRLTAPRRPRAGQRVRLRFRGEAEVPRRLLLVRLLRGRVACGQADASHQSERRIGAVGNVGGRISFDLRTPRLAAGRWTVCSYLQKSTADPRAEKRVRTLLTVRR
ncbi:hypothetical protein [Conexibacter woesei]|uniref:Ig-like domain-containing protein n=1 Tax=Conexibacter woesei (strain DSM 14684 / CCUG 47730 / CIP 108061 / JCM 11494 / NBRC 100937 / ID131577) TaxID=469383 RepID=D3EZ49_CONWI|nr:hypothetical protein [Conexibacter woesei]ADB51814.1 hypothetical protein Cwoe_3396 [Conexibacter woesei DSM 14684]